MTARQPNRESGFTIIELLVVFLILGILISLVLVGIQRARRAALRAEDQNNLKQVGLALHNYAATQQGRLPWVPTGKKVGRVSYPIERTRSVFVSLRPFLDQGNLLRQKSKKQKTMAPLMVLLSPADPTVAAGISDYWDLTSYAANTKAFPNAANLRTTIVDGLSNTILFSERYAYDCQRFVNSYTFNTLSITGPYRRATFADIADVKPITTGNPPITESSDKEKRTFQVTPSIKECSTWLLQTPFPEGILAGLGDASVRLIAPDISSSTFWSAVTPAGGEVLGRDW